MPKRDIVVLGASAGGVEALCNLAGQLPGDLPAALFVVQHTGAASGGRVAELMSRRGALPAVTAEDGMSITPGRICVAPPDRHLLLVADGVRVVYGPRENYCRPAIDPLFRTAAVHWRSRVVGVILTGMLNDGAAGLVAVRRCGGLAVVQAPGDAASPQMPRAALASVDADHQPTLAELGALLVRLVHEPAPDPQPVPKALSIEAALTEGAVDAGDAGDAGDAAHGDPTPFICPECGGALRRLGDPHAPHFRCHVGHAFTERALLDGQDQAAESALWVALRTLTERARLLEAMAGDEEARGRRQSAAVYRGRARESQAHAESIHRLLERLV